MDSTESKKNDKQYYVEITTTPNGEALVKVSVGSDTSLVVDGLANSKFRYVLGIFFDSPLPTSYVVKESVGEPPYNSLKPGIRE
jgi:hypothetical protein